MPSFRRCLRSSSLIIFLSLQVQKENFTTKKRLKKEGKRAAFQTGVDFTCWGFVLKSSLFAIAIGTVLLVGWGECESIYIIFSLSFKTLHSISVTHLTICILPCLFSILYLLNKTLLATCNNWGGLYKSQWAKFAVSIFQHFFFKSWFIIQGYLGDNKKRNVT